MFADISHGADRKDEDLRQLCPISFPELGFSVISFFDPPNLITSLKSTSSNGCNLILFAFTKYR